MSPEKMRVAIAEACGFTNVSKDGRYAYREDLCGKTGRCSLPDYLNSLDAMAEAEKVLTLPARLEFLSRLHCIVRDLSQDKWEAVSGAVLHFAAMWPMHQATAAQRAESFLRATNLWEDGE